MKRQQAQLKKNNFSSSDPSNGWLVSTKNKNNIKPKPIKNIINPIFIKCAEISTDQFWINLFNNAAIGKMPKKFTYKNEVLYFKKGNRTAQVTIILDDVYEVEKMVKNFFNMTDHLRSDKDVSNEEDHIREKMLNFGIKEYKSWKDVPEKMHEILIDNYCREMIEYYSLDKRGIRNLRHIINIGFSLEYFKKDNIKINNNRIEYIEGLIHNKEGFSIDPNIIKGVKITSKNKNKEKNPKSKDCEPKFLQRFQKLLNSVEDELLIYTESYDRNFNIDGSLNYDNEENDDMDTNCSNDIDNTDVSINSNS